MTTTKTDREVRLGDRTVVLDRFSAYKMLEVTEALASIGDVFPEALDAAAEFVGNYELKHAPQMQRAAAEFQYGEKARDVSDAAWESASNILRMPAEAPPEAIIAAIFPAAFRRARQQVTTLLCLLATANSEFEKADEDNDDIYAPDGLLATKRREILHKAKTNELVSLLAAAIDVCQDEIMSIDKADLGKLRDLIGLGRLTKSPAEPPSDERSSSSGSRARSRGGRAGKSSTGSPGKNSAPSQTS